MYISEDNKELNASFQIEMMEINRNCFQNQNKLRCNIASCSVVVLNCSQAIYVCAVS